MSPPRDGLSGAPRRRAPDPLRETRVLRRYVQVGVYGILLAFVPVQIFLFGEPFKWALINNIVFFTLATLAIEGAFINGRKIRKRMAYPVTLLLEMREARSMIDAAAFAAETALLVMKVDAAVFAIRGHDNPVSVRAAGIDQAAAVDLVESYAPTIDSARETGSITRIGDRRDQLIFVPLSGASEDLGIMILRANRRSDVRDTQTLQNIGTRLGLYFETLWQKEQLAREQAHSQAVLEAMPDVMVRVRADGTITYFASKATDEARPAAGGELLGRNVYDLLPQELGAQVRERIADVLRDGKLVRFEYDMPTESGTAYREARLVRVGDDEVLAIIRDTSDTRQAEEALREREEYFRKLIENAHDPIVVVSGDGTVKYASPALTRMLGYSSDQLVGVDALELIDPEDREKLVQAFAREVPPEGSSTSSVEFRALHKSGAWRVIEATARQLTPGDPDSEIVVNGRDITERKKAADVLRESEERMRTIFEEAPIGMAIVASDLRILSVNNALCAMLGYSEEEIVALGTHGFTHPEDLRKDDSEMTSLMAGDIPSYRVEKRYKTKSGDLMWGDLTATVIRDGEGKVLYGLSMIENITDRRHAEATVRHLAFHDPLTGLPNRALSRDRLELAIAQARRAGHMAAVMFLDLDRFKLVNDSVGHAEGDRLLAEVAEKISAIVREGDTVSRVGGDEFTILLPTVDSVQGAVRIAGRILNGLSDPFVVAGKEFLISGSIGITITPDDGDDADTLLRNADIAMYRAKEQGRNQYQLFAPHMNEEIMKRINFETSLRHAVERDEFVLHYQPQFDVKTMEVTGVEALVRWVREDGTLMMPADFIPVAEETGLIVPLGDWVLRRACEQAKDWQNTGLPPVRVSVNVSAREFHSADVAQRIEAVLEETGLDAACLQVEITEGVAMEHAEVTLVTLRRLKAMGVRLALDDFGIGYSSLSYLKRFPIDVLKIDCSFVRNVGQDPADTALVGAIITMAHSLGLRVIAEGVETADQLEFLRDPAARVSIQRIAVCDEFQGFLAGRPVPVEEVEQLLRRGKGSPELTPAKRSA
jgi:diguanylate cyclase (GGDEF)-like protein/PAS domain S-box-containing protein